MLYPRDPSLDPQLVWKGKDEQDASALAGGSIFVQIGDENVHLVRNGDGANLRRRRSQRRAPI